MQSQFISSHSFEVPHYMTHSAWVEHIPFAFELTARLKPALLVELGVHTGVSYFSFCQAVQLNNLPCACYAVDTWAGDEHAGFYGEHIFNQVAGHNQENYAAFSSLLRMDFDNALSYFGDKTIDLLHIDGLHTYEAVKKDFESWLPKLSDSSIVLFHDIAVRERGFGVFRLWEELAAVYPSFTFIHGFGLGVLATGKNIPSELSALFQYTGNDIQEVRSCYARLGSSVAEKFGLKEFGGRIGQLLAEGEQLSKAKEAIALELEALKEENASLHQQAAETLASLASVKGELEIAHEEKARLAEEIAGNRVAQENAALENSRQAREISEKKARLEALEEECLRLGKEIKDCHNSISWKITRPIRKIGHEITRLF